MRAIALLVLVGASAPLAAQGDPRVEALATALEQRRSEYLPGTPWSRILVDTLRTAADAPDRARLVSRLVRELGARAGISEDHCRRIPVDHPWTPVGLEVHGVDAIAMATLDAFTPDSAYVWVSFVAGSHPYMAGPRGYSLRRDAAGWQATNHLNVSHGVCEPRLFPDPIALAARAMLDDLGAVGPTCLDPTGFPLIERDAVAEVLGAEVRGQWAPPPRPGAPLPEPYADPCQKAETEWGSVLKFLNVNWVSDDLIHVTVEGRRMHDGAPTGASARQVRYTLRRAGDEWLVSEQAVLP